MKYFWVTCLGCGDEWVTPFVGEFGLLTPVEENGECCTDCGGEVEIGDEYEGMGEG